MTKKYKKFLSEYKMKEKTTNRKLVELYSDMVYKIAKSYLKNTDDAEDIVQEVFVKYLDNKRPFINAEHEKNWIIRVTINLCYNELRSTQRRNKLCKTYQDEVFYEEHENSLCEYINKLKERYRVVFELYYLHDFTTKEISKILLITDMAVRTRLKRARNQLKKLMKEKGDWF